MSKNESWMSKTSSGIIVTVIGGILLTLALGWIVGDDNQNTSSEEISISTNNQAENISETENSVNNNPSSVPTPSPTRDNNPTLNLPFYDNFDNGINSEWRILNGRPIIVNGKLSAGGRSDELTLEIGNSRLKTYEVQFEVSASDNPNWGGYWSSIELLVQSRLKVRIYASDGQGRITWFGYEDNEWEEISRSYFPDYASGDNFSLTVNSNSYRMYQNGQLINEFIYGTPPASGFPLLLILEGDNILLDDFSVTD